MGRAGLLPYLVLLQTGYAEHAASPRHLVGSCPTVSPLPRKAWRFAFCGAVRGSPLLGIAQRPALWSPDFPPRAEQDARARSDGLSASRVRPQFSSKHGRRACRSTMPAPRPGFRQRTPRRPAQQPAALPPRNAHTRKSGVGSWSSSESAGRAGDR